MFGPEAPGGTGEHQPCGAGSNQKTATVHDVIIALPRDPVASMDAALRHSIILADLVDNSGFSQSAREHWRGSPELTILL